jgi:hypothetical protein
MLKILILTDDIAAGRSLVEQLDIPKIYILDEELVRDGTGIVEDPDSAGYPDRLLTKMRSLVKNFTASRPIAIILDMRYHRAVELIPHEISCLLYDGSKSRRLAYNPTYKTMFRAKDLDDQSVEMLAKTIKNIA